MQELNKPSSADGKSSDKIERAAHTERSFLWARSERIILYVQEIRKFKNVIKNDWLL